MFKFQHHACREENELVIRPFESVFTLAHEDINGASNLVTMMVGARAEPCRRTGIHREYSKASPRRKMLEEI